MSSGLTTTSHALLGLLSVRPWTTYELAKQVTRSLGWFWPRTERKLYDEPKRLVAEGLATATAERTGRRPRTVYAITPKGRRELRRWLGEPPAPPSLAFEGMVKTFFADAGTLAQLRATLAEIERGAEDRLRELQAMAAETGGPRDDFAKRAHLNALALRFQLDHEALVAAWARWAAEQTRTWAASDDPAGWDVSEALHGAALVRDAAVP